MVRFTDGNGMPEDEGISYSCDETVLGRAWIPDAGLILTPPVRVRYEKHPWITAFEFDGIKPAPARRNGIGTKDARGFVKSLSTIYSRAYDDYREFGGDDAFDAPAYFAHAAEHFAGMASDDSKRKMYSKFCGFTENMWREGNEEMLKVCMEIILPVLASGGRLFMENITEEFREYIDRSKSSSVI